MRTVYAIVSFSLPLVNWPIGARVSSHFSGRGDPRATLSLLWGLPRTPKPGRKPSLSPELIGAAAMSLADASGLEALSMRALGEELGVSTMSLYRYVPGKPELLDLILELAYGELPQELPEGDWPTRLRRLARDTWDLYLRHPWMLEISMYRASLGPYSIAKYERELSAVAGIGLTDLEMDLTVSAVSDYVRGAASKAVEGRVARQATGRSDEEWWDLHSSFVEELVDPKVFPLAVRIGAKAGAEYGGTTDPAISFDFGVERLIQGLQGLLESRPGH